jgi:hypothetical protein
MWTWRRIMEDENFVGGINGKKAAFPSLALMEPG